MHHCYHVGNACRQWMRAAGTQGNSRRQTPELAAPLQCAAVPAQWREGSLTPGCCNPLSTTIDSRALKARAEVSRVALAGFAQRLAETTAAAIRSIKESDPMHKNSRLRPSRSLVAPSRGQQEGRLCCCAHLIDAI